MRLFLSFLIACFLSVSTLNAQIAVKSFRILPTDQTARITNPETDQNGDKCALIKVVTDQSGFAWEGGMLGITKTIKKTGEYWVYVPHGAKRITIKHDHLGILRDYIFPEAIKEATVYEMVLTTGTVKTIVEKQELKSQWVVINTNPEKADVYIDDTHRGLTPFYQEFKEGSHTYRISKDLYHTEAGLIDLSSETGKYEMNIELKPNYGFVNIKSTPESEAEIFIDNIPIGKTTPLISDSLSSGLHTIMLSHKWYENAEKKLEITDGELSSVNIDMTPLFAEFEVKANPETEIYINDRLEGKGKLNTRLMAGTYILELRLLRYHNIKDTINVVAGMPIKKEYNLKAAFGGLSIKTIPEDGAEISVDGKLIGKSTPCFIDYLPNGEYTIGFRKDWYEPAKVKITVKEGETTEIKQKLIPNFADVNISTSPESDIYIDNKLIGKGTYSGRISLGIHTFEARKENHQSDMKKEEIILGEKYNIDLRPLAKLGNLKVISNPIDASITINGKESGSTPANFYDMIIGDYTLKLSKEGYSTQSKNITILEGQTENVSIDLEVAKVVSKVAVNKNKSCRIYGNISSEKKGDLPGVTILVKGTSIGTISDINGNYSLSVPAGATTLVYSFVGYKSKEIQIGESEKIDVIMGGKSKKKKRK